MSSFTKNFEYQGPPMPSNTVVPPELNEHITIRRISCTADDSSVLTAGVICYLGGTTQANDMKASTDEWGKDLANGKCYVVEIQEHNPHFATTIDQPEYPNRMPNSNVTLSNYAATANQPVIVIPLEIGMKFWGVIGNAVNASVTKDTIYNVNASGGIIGAIDDPSPDAIVGSVHGFRAIATVTNNNWALFEYVGFVGLDTT